MKHKEKIYKRTTKTYRTEGIITIKIYKSIDGKIF